MFTGLVQHVGVVVSRDDAAFGARLTLAVGGWPDARGRSEVNAADAPWGPCQWPLALGESISVSGCCLTLAQVECNEGASGQERFLGFDVIHQTLRVTALGRVTRGDRLNLERCVTPQTLLGGHIVQGHVDGTGSVEAILRDRGEWRMRVRMPEDLLRYVHNKGSIALDGVSLTVADLDDQRGTLDVCLIPETLARTSLGDRAAGDAIHVEVDCLAKMVERLIRR